MNVILLGAPGAGKGTQGALLVKRYGGERVSTGELLRDAVRRGTSLGQEAKKYMDAGELVPDDVILGLVRETLTSAADAGFILDGFPRTLAQAEALDGLLDDLGFTLDAVVVIDVPDDVLVKRLSGRRSCAECGAVYNVYFEPPRTPGRCDVCGGALVERADDDAATVRRRLAVYDDRTRPLIAYYRRSDSPVYFVDGERPVDDVHEAIVGFLESGDRATAAPDGDRP